MNSQTIHSKLVSYISSPPSTKELRAKAIGQFAKLIPYIKPSFLLLNCKKDSQKLQDFGLYSQNFLFFEANEWSK
jgi:hypothetical protein